MNVIGWQQCFIMRGWSEHGFRRGIHLVEEFGLEMQKFSLVFDIVVKFSYVIECRRVALKSRNCVCAEVSLVSRRDGTPTYLTQPSGRSSGLRSISFFFVV